MSYARSGLPILALLTLSPSLATQAPLEWTRWPVSTGYHASDHAAAALPNGGIAVHGGLDAVGVEIVSLSLCSIEPVMIGGMDFCIDITPTVRPSARLGQAMAYDPIRDCLVMFGGCDAQGVNCRQRFSAPPPAMISKVGAALSHFAWVSVSMP